MPDATPSDNLTVLVLEDNPSLRDLYWRTLSYVGCAVFSTGTIGEARTLIGSYAFDIFICDMHLGKERTLDLLRAEINTLKAAGTQIIAVTGEAQYEEDCAALGVEFYLQKPVSIGALTTLVGRLGAIRNPTGSARLNLRHTALSTREMRAIAKLMG